MMMADFQLPIADWCNCTENYASWPAAVRAGKDQLAIGNRKLAMYQVGNCRGFGGAVGEVSPLFSPV
jgi:hypothetical protein